MGQGCSYSPTGWKSPHSLLSCALTGDVSRCGLPQPDHRPFESHPLPNTQIRHYLSHGDCVAEPDVDRLDGEEVVFAAGDPPLSLLG